MSDLTPEQAAKILDEHKEELAAWRASVEAARELGEEPPPPPANLVDALSVVAHELGNVLVGVGGTAADFIGIFGGTLETLHESANSFFSNLRGRLGI